MTNFFSVKNIYISIRKFILSLLPKVYFVSFPKSGRTWVRYFLSMYFHQLLGTKKILEFDRIIPLHRKIPRAFFTHGTFDSDDLAKVEKHVSKLTDSRVVYIARDPRDVVVSLYFQMKKRRGHIDENISEFVRHPAMGITKIVRYMNLWITNKNRFSDFLLLRYEELSKDPVEKFKELLLFLDVPVDDKILKRAIELSNFDNMKKAEMQGALNDPQGRLTPADPNDPESYKTRKGKVGGYRDYLNTADIAFCNDAMKELNPDFGYSVNQESVQ